MAGDETFTSNKHRFFFFTKIKEGLLQAFYLTGEHVVKVYHGYGNDDKLIVFGHVFRLSPMPRKSYRQNFFTNFFSLLRSFMIVHVQGARVMLQWDGKIYETTTAHDGFFRFECTLTKPPAPGMHSVKVDYISKENQEVIAEGAGRVMVPDKSQLAFISDIDDTFLISHSSNLRKRLYVLFTKNAHSRRPFDGVVNHYNLLAKAQMKDGVNPFFYVSSSEWNLYDLIKEFCRKNNLPEGVFLLSQVKRLSQILKTGGTKHAAKFMRITRIMEAFPQCNFVLLGDDSQMDPTIYASIVHHFPGRIKSVYLRHVYEKNISHVHQLIEQIENAGVPVCHFEHSTAAIEHSYKTGLL